MRKGLRQALALVIVVLMLLALFGGGAQPQAAGVIPAPWDKLAHVGFFAVFAVLLRWGLGWPVWLALLGSVLIGAADEWHQATLPGRFASLEDWFADLAGALLGLWILRRATLNSARS